MLFHAVKYWRIDISRSNQIVPICNKGPESIRHLLFVCPVAIQVWKLLGVWDVIQRGLAMNTCGEVMLDYLLSLPDDHIHVLGLPKLRETVATCCWYLWWERRKITHGGDPQTAPQINLVVRSLAENFIVANSPRPRVHLGGWMRPRTGYVKLNVDASFDQDLLEGSAGAVIRDHKGKFIAAANEKLRVCYDAFTAEAIAIRFGLNLARTTGCSKVEVNSDNSDVVEALREGYSALVASAIFDDCYFMSLEFSHIVYEHYFRENNKVAHELASLARFNPPDV